MNIFLYNLNYKRVINLQNRISDAYEAYNRYKVRFDISTQKKDRLFLRDLLRIPIKAMAIILKDIAISCSIYSIYSIDL